MNFDYKEHITRQEFLDMIKEKFGNTKYANSLKRKVFKEYPFCNEEIKQILENI